MDNVCRTCLRVPTNLTPLYVNSTLISKIETIASIQVIKDDNYPSNICQECITNVNILYNFRRVIINSDKELQERAATLERLKKSSPQKAAETSKTPIVKKEHFDPLYVEMAPLDPSSESSSQTQDEQECETDVKESVKKAMADMKRCKCNICDKTFPSRFKLYSHKRTEHVAPGVCNVCGMVVRSDNLKRHIQLHLAQPVECKDCGKIFKNSESLRGHMLIHKGVIYTCEICGRMCKVKSEYKRHMKSHIRRLVKSCVRCVVRELEI
ncbi:zinc finger and BTB domain-containing protein 49-like isoform X2 [Zophobas morio]|uniref:zinc finger and BTB domain-containing protein 49-like isoform X2 n=1 Tax=Zophobas morio TaxID=2755281 RepID=UPI003083E55C